MKWNFKYLNKNTVDLVDTYTITYKDETIRFKLTKVKDDLQSIQSEK